MTERPSRHSLPWYVPIMVGAFVLNAWVAAAVSPYAAVRTLVVAVAAVSALVLVLGLISGRRWQSAGLIVAGIAVAISGFHVDIASVGGRIGGWTGLVWIGAVVALIAVVLRFLWRFVRSPGGLERMTRLLNQGAAILLAVVLLTGWADGAISAAVDEIAAANARGTLASAREPVAASSPDIYVILLDGYPRADTLLDRYNLDNSTFLDRLEGLGFEVADASRTNYMFTQLVLLSMLHMKHADAVELDGPTDTVAHINRTVRAAINESPAIDLLHEHGYSITASSPGYESVVLRQADTFLDSGGVNEFERHLLRRTLLIDIIGFLAPSWLPNEHRNRVHSNFRDLRMVARSESDHPRFTFVHVASPHAPNVFRTDGSPIPVSNPRALYGDTPELMGISRSEFAAQVRGQVTYLNSITLAAVEEVLQVSAEPPVIVVMSDHGTRMDVTYGDPSDPDLGERMGNLFAAYTPGRDGLFGEGITPVNVLPIIFNTYLGTHLACQPDHAFATGPHSLFDLHRLSPAPSGTNPACGLDQ